MTPDPVAHRAAMADLADHYFAAQCRRLGPINGAPAPRPIRLEPHTTARRPARAFGPDRSKL